MTRSLLIDSIIQDAEEDLMRLLIEEDLDPKKFNYSPYILRCINEKILKNGFSLGLGYKSRKSLIDKYWNKLTLPLKADVIIRIINRLEINQDYQVVILLKNSDIQKILWNDLYELKSIKPRNDRVFTGIVSVFKEKKINTIINEITVILEKKKLSFVLEEYLLMQNEITKGDKIFHLFVPESFDYSCSKCNMCEFPSNYSINPIPNKCNQPYSELLSSERIGFPSNLVCLELSEIEQISNEIEMRLEEYSLPILVIKEMSGKVTDIQFGLKQNKGICIFQDLHTNNCKIHNIKPNNCRLYPFILTDKGDNHYSVELDFSCPGVSINTHTGYNFSLDNLLKTIKFAKEFRWEQFDNILSKWDLSNYYTDGNRVKEDDVQTALDYIQADFENSKRSDIH